MSFCRLKSQCARLTPCACVEGTDMSQQVFIRMTENCRPIIKGQKQTPPGGQKLVTATKCQNLSSVYVSQST